MATFNENSDNSLTSLSLSSGRSSNSQRRSLRLSPTSPSLNELDNSFFSNLFATPVHEDNLQSQDNIWNQEPPAHVEPEPKKPVTIGIKKKKEEKDCFTEPQMNVTKLIQDYTDLMMLKGKIDSRRFNKNAFALLDNCIAALRSLDGTMMVASEKEPTLSKYRDDAKEAFGEFRRLLLNAKEMHSETLVERVVTFINNGLLPSLTADERKEELQKKSLAFITELSPSMSIKIAPIIKSYIARQFGSDLEDLLAEVRLPEMSPKMKTLMYARMFGNLMDDPKCVSFAATNKQLLGDLLPVDVWFLTFFAFVTVRRSRGDNLLMLGLVGALALYFIKYILLKIIKIKKFKLKFFYLFLGKSSVGKSLLFESIVLVTGHQLLSSTSSSSGDAGVGRFSTGSKNIVSHFHGVGNIFFKQNEIKN